MTPNGTFEDSEAIDVISCLRLRSRVGLQILVLVVLACGLPSSAEDLLIQYGPKEPLRDHRLTGYVLSSDLPPDLAAWWRNGPKLEPFRFSRDGSSNDSRVFKAYPGLTNLRYDRAQIEEVHVNSVVLPDYGVLASLPRLREASITAENAKQLPQSLLDALSTDQNLNNLRLYGDVSRLDLSVLARSSKLAVIRLSNSNLNPRNVRQLSKIKSLRCLELGDRTLSADCVKRFDELEQITDLRIRPDSEVDLSSLKELPNLSRLEFNGKLGPNTVEQISELKNLRELTVKQITDSEIHFLSGLKNLTSLHLIGSSGVIGSRQAREFTGETLSILQQIPLKYLSVVSNRQISPAGFKNISELQGLKGLDISWTNPTEDALLSFANLKNLRRLHASCIQNYDGLKKLSRKLPYCTIQAYTDCPGY